MSRQAYQAPAEFNGDVLIQGELKICGENAVFGVLKTYTEELDLVGAAVAATVNPPAGSILISCDTIVTEAIGAGAGVTGYTVGDGAAPAQFGTVVGLTAGLTSGAADYAAAAVPALYTAAPTITITATGGNPFVSGKIRYTAIVLETQGPQS